MNLSSDELTEIAAVLVAAVMREREAVRQNADYGYPYPKDRPRLRILTDALGKITDEMERMRPVPPKAVA